MWSEESENVSGTASVHIESMQIQKSDERCEFKLVDSQLPSQELGSEHCSRIRGLNERPPRQWFEDMRLRRSLIIGRLSSPSLTCPARQLGRADRTFLEATSHLLIRHKLIATHSSAFPSHCCVPLHPYQVCRSAIQDNEIPTWRLIQCRWHYQHKSNLPPRFYVVIVVHQLTAQSRQEHCVMTVSNCQWTLQKAYNEREFSIHAEIARDGCLHLRNG